MFIGHICASTSCVYLWSLGALVPQHLVFLNGHGAHLSPPVAIQTSRIGARTVPSSSSDVPAKGGVPPQYRVRREVGCVVRASLRASRFGLRRCFKGLGVGGWMFNFVFLWVRRAAACVVRCSFRASRLGLRRCFQGLGVGGWMFEFCIFFGCVARLPAS